MKILLPISLDRWRNPISSLLRACVEANPQIEFHSFSKPDSEEDVQNGKALWNLPQLKRGTHATLLKVRFDLVHTASYSHGNQIASIIAKLRGVPRTKVLNTMNLEVKPDDPVSWKRYQSMLKVVDHFAAVSEAVADCLRPDVGDRFCRVIPNGFDPQFLDPELVSRTDLPESLRNVAPGSFVLCVAAIEPRKRPEVLMELALRHPDLTFVLAGAVTSQASQEFLQDLRKVPNLHLLGSVSRREVRALLAHAGVFAFPSDREGLPLAIIEALGMGLPVVCQPKSSMPELVREGDNGRLIDAADLNAWGEALKHYVAMEPSERRNLSVRLRTQACELYSWPMIGRAYGSLYESLCAK